MWTQLAVNLPVAAAVIYTVKLFLSFLTAERKSSDARSEKAIEVLESQRVALTELTIEVKQQSVMLRNLAPQE